MRQPLLFLLIGILQYVLDSSLFGVLVYLSVPTAVANIASRASAATIGFMLNRTFTFDKRNEGYKRLAGSMLRFAVLFIILTVVSTLSIMSLEQAQGSGLQNMIIYKVLVESVLAVVSYVVAKHWVFR